jgi:3'-phosphoadenosine 5'-phosphosulfate sulfotransferase (PAPS reductase)/FAD synthetase
MKKIRHVLGISGGKDSAALAIYLNDRYPNLELEFYTCDTGKELDETYELIKNLESYLGKKIIRLKAAEGSTEEPFDHYLKMYGNFLPSSNSRWCTKKLKLEPFEKFVGNDLVVSYVGIRGDEEREGYISRKSNIQSIFPFRKNIWSEDVIAKILANNNIDIILNLCNKLDAAKKPNDLKELLLKPLSPDFPLSKKTNMLLDINIKGFNSLVFAYLKETSYPLANEQYYPLIDNEDILYRDDIIKILENSGVGVPKYYNKIEFEVNNKEVGQYSRTRSGCYFCFFQQKIEWIWLYEQHKPLFELAQGYEKDGYTWNQDESLTELIKPDRVNQIKEEYIKRTNKKSKEKSPYLLDILEGDEGEGCAACFI